MATATTTPLISCIMPTWNRRPFIPHAIRYFLRQDYASKELIIIDDGTDPIEDLIPNLPEIRYYRLSEKISLGAKLNLACQYASGPIIAHWDDDDWYAARRLSYQSEVFRADQIDICGINNLLYYDLRSQQAYNYIYPADQRLWLLGSSLCYRRSYWEQHRFADINVGMDGLFVWETTPEHILNHPDPTFAVHMIHTANISPKKTDSAWWHAYPADRIREIMGPDWVSYNTNGNAPLPVPVPIPQFSKPTLTAPSPAVKNIYACLVHERPDCIMDLVRNLRYHDPSSVILLYNGGPDPNLLNAGFPFEQWGAVVCPDPVPQQWGYLHHFALHCMEFALDSFSFDTMTIVDSDQLAIRPGYCQRLGEFLSAHPGAGLLSSRAERVLEADQQLVPAAVQAWREYPLWRPFLQQFQDGESKFVHWTFWPSTVFTHDAARDLVRLVRNNTRLQEIMTRSRIWASEEIVLPTLIKLLNYDILPNPCSYEYVRYKKIFTTQDLANALNTPDVWWVHPIARDMNNPLRTFIREQCDQYLTDGMDLRYSSGLDLRYPSGMDRLHTPGTDLRSPSGTAADQLLTVNMLNKIRRVQGWLSDAEGRLLMETAFSACREIPNGSAFAEIGSYHGKSTLLLGAVLQARCPGRKLHAIDPHDGLQGAADLGLQFFPPSYEPLRQNVQEAGLSATVDIIRARSAEAEMKDPIALLYIDGLHDYENVRADFSRFAPQLLPGGYLVFHDYAAYFPGVISFVDELLAAGHYQLVGSAETLIVLQQPVTNTY